MCLLEKRTFDIAVSVLTAWLWLPILAVTGLAILLFSGWPVFYVSPRQVDADTVRRLWKFRTMVRDAEKLANRDTIPATKQRFLNLPSDSPLYTPVGRVCERLCFTELPQLVHVLLGHLSLVGNRPLPTNVVASLLEAYPAAENRFLTKCGVTGPVQLVGRQEISDQERIDLETLYCRLSLTRCMAKADFMMLFYTVLVGLRLRRRFTPQEVGVMLCRYAGGRGQLLDRSSRACPDTKPPRET